MHEITLGQVQSAALAGIEPVGDSPLPTPLDFIDQKGWEALQIVCNYYDVGPLELTHAFSCFTSGSVPAPEPITEGSRIAMATVMALSYLGNTTEALQP